MANILIVDDEEADLLGLESLLEPLGHEVFLARDGDEALEIFLSRRIHLVLTDMVMPEKDGLGLIRALRSIDPGAAIIALSGKSPGQLEASKVFGARSILTKPVGKEELLAAVHDVVGSP